jgi:hypothetical protein
MYSPYPLSDLVTFNGTLYAMGYTSTSTSRIWVINNHTVTATYTGLCGGGVPVYPFMMNCNGYLLIPCSTPKAVYLYMGNGTYVSNLNLTYPSNGLNVDSIGRLISVVVNNPDIIEIIYS